MVALVLAVRTFVLVASIVCMKHSSTHTDPCLTHSRPALIVIAVHEFCNLWSSWHSTFGQFCVSSAALLKVVFKVLGSACLVVAITTVGLQPLCTVFWLRLKQASLYNRSSLRGGSSWYSGDLLTVLSDPPVPPDEFKKGK